MVDADDALGAGVPCFSVLSHMYFLKKLVDPVSLQNPLKQLYKLRVGGGDLVAPHSSQRKDTGAVEVISLPRYPYLRVQSYLTPHYVVSKLWASVFGMTDAVPCQSPVQDSTLPR